MFNPSVDNTVIVIGMDIWLIFQTPQTDVTLICFTTLYQMSYQC